MADAVIAVSRETKNDIEHLFKVRSERLHVIYKFDGRQDSTAGVAEDDLFE